MTSKKLLCDHIYKTVTKKYLRTEREPYGREHRITVYKNFEYFSEKQRCILCRDERIVERKYFAF